MSGLAVDVLGPVRGLGAVVLGPAEWSVHRAVCTQTDRQFEFMSCLSGLLHIVPLYGAKLVNLFCLQISRDAILPELH